MGTDLPPETMCSVLEYWLTGKVQNVCGKHNILPTESFQIDMHIMAVCFGKLVVLYGCETWSLTLREEHRLGVFENRVLRRIFGPKTDEVTGEWRKLHNEELHDLYSLPSIIRLIKARRMI
jgi:hypothetical protein